MTTSSEDPMQHRLISEFIYDSLAGVPSCHASTIVELPDGSLAAAWFGGAVEGSPDASHYWARKRPGGSNWEPPQKLWDIPNHSAGNPRLFMTPDGILWAILPVNFGKWCNGGTRFFYRISSDLGETWNEPVHVPHLDTLLGKNKPVVFPDGRFVLPVTLELTKGSAAVIYCPDDNRWLVSAPIFLPGAGRCIQPTFGLLPDGRMLGLFRTGCGRIWKAFSHDDGMTWSEPVATILKHNDSGIDLVVLRNGHLALVFNDTEKGRTPLNVAISTDNGETWAHQITLEGGPGEFSYPAMIQTRDNLLHITYTYLPGERKGPGRSGSKVKHVVVSEEQILGRKC